MTNQFLLQFFNDEEAVTTEESMEIPQELEGVSEEVAREIVAEMETTEDADTDSENNGKIPYARFKKMNDERKAYEEENKELKRQMAALRQQMEQPQEAPTVNEPEVKEPVPKVQQAPKVPQPAPAEMPTMESVPIELLGQAHDLAKQEVLAQMGLNQDEYDDLEYTDEVKRQQIDRAINFKYTMICEKAREHARQLHAQQQMRDMAYQEAYQEYNSFAESEQKRDDFANIWEFASNEFFNSLPAHTRQVVQETFDRVNAGQGDYAQVRLVMDFYKDAKNEYLSRANKPETVTKNTNKIPKAPRVDKVRGTPSGGAIGVTDLENLLNNSKWEDIPEDMREKILSGRL